MTFDPRAICEALNDEGVDYVIIGGFAAAIHGTPLPLILSHCATRPIGNDERSGGLIAEALSVRAPLFFDSSDV